MRRRVFIGGSILAAAAVAGEAWRSRAGRGAGRATAATPARDGRHLVRGAALAFGTTVSIAALAEDRDAALGAIDEALEAVRGVDALMTVFRPGSQVARLNATGTLDHPDPALVKVLAFCQRLSAASDGAFDVTVQPLWLLFAACRSAGRLPSRAEISAARARVDWRALEVSPRRISLGRPGMSITLNGVAQGHAADVALAVLRARGVRDALVDAGEYGAEGAGAAGRPWTLGIQHPREPGAVIAAVEMDGRFLATSGDYETAFSEDRLYHHIFDPRTGVSPTALSSVAVAAETGMEADALTKPMMVLDLPAAQALLAWFRGAGAIWIDKECRVVAAERMRFAARAGG